ncbi:hypothetical protein G7062_09770 [Erysipelothrix sp. HDW6C]|uniref:hypothetical protein n=1 Tax=Erysipelothrix sp. HDW6C TaxID=2714930 RepID=UPI0014086DF5|nr:hypothetical protein [Erysipelothrix sp. HDW6C]QIK70571.1 hypothetical protein G7062_09770 [Erysipelothrix sp. HDW6C]
MEPKNTKSSTSSAVKEAYAQAVEQYNCDNCGAEVICDATMTSTTCVYCHNPVVLTGRVTGDFAPIKSFLLVLMKRPHRQNLQRG